MPHPVIRSCAQTGWILAAAIGVGACAMGPKYSRPGTAVPESYANAASTPAGVWSLAHPGDEISRGDWWAVFHDAQLETLEARLNLSNQNIAAAAANVLAARAMVREARAQYLPTVSASPSLTQSRLSTSFGRPVGLTFTTYALPVDASWEPDLWGRVRNTVASNTFSAQAATADLENIRLSAQAELATDYYELRMQDVLRQVLDQAAQADQDALDVTRARFDSGLETDEAVAQAEAQLAAVQAQETNSGILRAEDEHAIARLIGEPASSFSLPVQTLTFVTPSIPVGVPSDLLQRRPDVASAERAMAAANAQMGFAQGAFFPTLLLTATGGFEALSLSQWLSWPNRIWSLGPSLAQTIFDGGLRRATVQQVRANYDRTVATYRETVLNAFEDVEDSLSTIRLLTDVIDQQDHASQASARSLDEATTRYQSGIDPYLNVITAQTVLLANQQAVALSRGQQMVTSVQLIKALGGAWDAASLPSPRELKRTP